LKTGNRSGAGSVQGVSWAVDGPFGARRCSAGGTRPKEVDAMRARRFSKVARCLGTSALLVLALASCGNSETKSATSNDGAVSVGRETAGVGSPAWSGSDLAQSSEDATGINRRSCFSRRLWAQGRQECRSRPPGGGGPPERRAGAAGRRDRRWHCTQLAGLQERRLHYGGSRALGPLRGVRKGTR
jgi:hypothetical protein